MKFASKARALRIGGTVVARTPLLLPAFSSQAPIKKVGEAPSEADLQSYVARLGETVAGPILISAYDLYHGHLPKPEADTAVFGAPLTFIDSGGYELLCDKAKPFDGGDYQVALGNWPVKAQAVAVNFDCPANDLGAQIETAIAVSDGNALGRELLLKPGDNGLDYLLASVPDHRDKLAQLSVIGITEKEAGRSLKERLETISRLRTQLDKVGLVDMPIHVFGGLDPVRSHLYFLAGGDIFDGHSWLRFAFDQGKALYLDAFASVQYPQLEIVEAEWQVRRRNIFMITDMQTAMRRFLVSANLDDLHPEANRICEKLFS